MPESIHSLNAAVANPNTATAADATTTASPTRIAIIGAGLTGLITATLLERKFSELGQALKIDIFEKSGGVGRLATRYKKPATSHTADGAHEDKQWQFEFGAQFFTAKSSEFKSFIQPWLAQEVITPWHAQVAQLTTTAAEAQVISLSEPWSDSQPRYISSPKMTSWGRAIAKALQHTTLHYKTRVAPLADRHIDHTTHINTALWDDQGNALGKYDWVIVTAPTVQANELLESSSFAFQQEIAQRKMVACYTLMLGWQDFTTLPASIADATWEVLEVAGANQGASIGKIFIEHTKPQRDKVLPSITIHADNAWSEQHVDDEIESVKATLLAAVQQILGWTDRQAPQHIDCHRWRYAATATVSQTLPTLYRDQDKQWLVSGDWCEQGRIESCYQQAALSVASICSI